MNILVRKGSFDAGHRVMFQRFKCSHMHGHRYEYELHFSYSVMQEIGYAIDFSEIKRIACAWIDQNLDHAFILNPLDQAIIDLCKDIKSNYYLMHLKDEKGSCNPTVENIAKELFFVVSELMNKKELKLEKVVLNETANCVGICHGLSFQELQSFQKDSQFLKSLDSFKSHLGTIEYDTRKLSSP